MKETLYTIPLNDAFHANDECPFCFIERDLEHNSLDFILGTAYMESDIREETDKKGFCRTHLKQMYDYGNALGNALMLKTHYIRLNKEMKEQMAHYSPQKGSFKNPFKKTALTDSQRENAMASWVQGKENSCYVCDYNKNTYERYLDTFFYMYKKDAAFKEMVKESKGFCLHHFGELMEAGESRLSEKEKKEFSAILFPLMEQNMKRIEEDISWFVNKFDYRYKDQDWKNSRDAVPRGMQKLHGGYPADLPYKENK